MWIKRGLCGTTGCTFPNFYLPWPCMHQGKVPSTNSLVRRDWSLLPSWFDSQCLRVSTSLSKRMRQLPEKKRPLQTSPMARESLRPGGGERTGAPTVSTMVGQGKRITALVPSRMTTWRPRSLKRPQEDQKMVEDSLPSCLAAAGHQHQPDTRTASPGTSVATINQ